MRRRGSRPRRRPRRRGSRPRRGPRRRGSKGKKIASSEKKAKQKRFKEERITPKEKTKQ